MHQINRGFLWILVVAGLLLPALAVPAQAADSTWYAEYYNNPYLGGGPTVVRYDPSVNFDWGYGSPAPGIPVDNFSVRWSRTVWFDAGTYRFTTETDDGVRLFLDGQIIINHWQNQARTAYSADRTLAAGDHSLRMEYYEYLGPAFARLTWTNLGSTGNPSAYWLGEYFANTSLTGAPATVRNDPSISFNWGNGSPASNIPADYFSVRWTRTVWFDAGTYRFTTTTDDGVRLYLDGQLIINDWQIQPSRSNSADRALSAGNHSLRMEYFEQQGLASAYLSWANLGSPGYPTAYWYGEYFANTSLTGAPAMVRNDPSISFNWGNGSPGPNIPADYFAVRWTRTVSFDAGTYRFTTATDDGVRLYLDGQLIINDWQIQPSTTNSADRALSAGNHSLRMEYFEQTGLASAYLSWSNIGAPGYPTAYWLGEYFANTSLSGAPAMVRNDSSIGFNWGYGSPGANIPADYFSARWTRTVWFNAGTYRFTTATDDGVRLYLDGQLIINDWQVQPSTSNSADRTLSTGNHSLRMEYFEEQGLASAYLSWQSIAARPVGNIITCARPTDSRIKVYRLDSSNQWVDMFAPGYSSIEPSGYLKLDGMPVDTDTYGENGNPYWVQLWANGVLIRSAGNTARGEPSFRVRAFHDNYTPWGCPAP